MLKPGIRKSSRSKNPRF